MSFRRRLVGAATALTVATLGAAFFAVYVAVNRAQERQLDEALVAEATEEAREVASLGGDELAISDRPGPAANDVGPLTKYAALYADDGRALASTPTFRGGPPSVSGLRSSRSSPFDLWVAGEQLRGVLVDVPAHRAVLLLAAPRADLDGDAAFLRRAMLLVFAAAAAWAIAIAFWIVRRLTKDHEAIAEVARRVAAGDLAARVHTASTDSEVAQLAQDVNGMIERLSRLLAAQGTFIAHAAHELRAPLTTLYGELSHALRRERDGASYRASISDALESARRLVTLADDLLTLARLGGEPDEATEPVELGAVIDDARRMIAAEAEAKAVTVEASGAAPSLVGRRRDLARLFRNVLENAVRHSPPRGLVRTELRCAGEHLVATIADQGEGVKDDERERIFEPFYRGAATQGQGTGLGLAIAREIARAHGGDIGLPPSPHPGGVFIIRLPLKRA